MTLTTETVVGTTTDTLLPRAAFDGLTLVQAGLAKLLHTDVSTHHLHTALELIDTVESMARQLDAVQNKVFESIECTGVHSVDGHRTARTMIAHGGKLSSAEAGTRRKTMRALRVLPAVAAAFDAGLVSTCMVNKLGRVYANQRVRDLMADADTWFAQHALADTYEFFDLVVTQWESLADQDGAEQRDKRHDLARNHQMVQNEDGSWAWKGSCAAYDGAITNDILDAFETIEFDIDWQWVTATHGPKACADLMPRTAAQRRADAYAKVHVYAARALAAEGGPTVTTDILIDDETFEHETKKLLGDDVEATFPTREDFECRTLSGSIIPPRTAVSHGLLGHLRRVVIGADGVTIDLGRRRLFTGYARLAAQLNSTECYWPGCHVTGCQIDHLTPHSDRGRDPTTHRDRGGGATNPHNGGAACGTHNRHKEHGYTVTRLPDGAIHIKRPDGTTLT
ncbi:MAG: hypothetical protein ACI81L_003332 [Verrucomicrobiales bacterium]|jgi:hypothetical protein